MRENYRDRAVVIRSYDFGEADRVIVLLTQNHGLVRAVAKGVRRAKSRFGSRLQLFVNLDVQLYVGKNLATISQADTVNYFGARLIEDYERYTAACAVLESAERLIYADGDGDPYLYNAVVAALEQLQTDEPTQTLDAFLLQAMAHAGWAPSLFDCAQCQRPGPHHAFHPAVGGLPRMPATRCCRGGSGNPAPLVAFGTWLPDGPDECAAAGGASTSAGAPAVAHGAKCVRITGDGTVNCSP